MSRPITRRDFLDGIALAIGASLTPPKQGSYPPTLTGMRGSQPGSFEIAHALRDGAFWQNAPSATDTHQAYDLIVVGAGISGLAAAHFYRHRAGASARILILDNHDDFGGHARRNEFHVRCGLQLLNGGTELIDSPTPYSAQAEGLIKQLGIDPPRFQKQFADPAFYPSLGLRPAVFFDRETFGADRLVTGVPTAESPASWSEFLARTPLSVTVQRDVARVEESNIDYLPGLSSAEKKDRLSRISYKDFLLKVAKVDPGVVPFYQTRTHDEWGVGIDAEPALDCWAIGLPGFQGLNLEAGAAPRMSYSAAGYANGGSDRFHFPDGNASIARLLLRDLIPQAVPGHTAEDVVTSKVVYARLDEPASPIRIRLNSTVVRVRNASGGAVEATYVQQGGLKTVHAKACVLACWNTMIPYLCPELPEKQKAALHYLVKVPLVYTSVALGNWRAFTKLGVESIYSPGSYFSSTRLNWVVNIGDYKTPKTADDPMLLFLVRTPCKPGLPVREQQKAGRYELYSTPFATFERNIRSQLARMLGNGGFDPARDIEAVTVNRWAHGYGYEYNPLFDPDWPEAERPHVIGRQKFGNISIANTDSGATAYTDVAIDQAFRAVNELS